MITGTGVHDPLESAFKIVWNERSRSAGIGVHDPPELAGQKGIIALPRNTRFDPLFSTHCLSVICRLGIILLATIAKFEAVLQASARSTISGVLHT